MVVLKSKSSTGRTELPDHRLIISPMAEDEEMGSPEGHSALTTDI